VRKVPRSERGNGMSKTKFKVGDEVKVVKDSTGPGKMIGQKGEVVELGETGFGEPGCCVEFGGGLSLWFAYGELAPAEEPANRFSYLHIADNEPDCCQCLRFARDAAVYHCALGCMVIHHELENRPFCAPDSRAACKPAYPLKAGTPAEEPLPPSTPHHRLAVNPPHDHGFAPAEEPPPTTATTRTPQFRSGQRVQLTNDANKEVWIVIDHAQPFDGEYRIRHEDNLSGAGYSYAPQSQLMAAEEPQCNRCLHFSEPYNCSLGCLLIHHELRNMPYCPDDIGHKCIPTYATASTPKCPTCGTPTEKGSLGINWCPKCSPPVTPMPHPLAGVVIDDQAEMAAAREQQRRHTHDGFPIKIPHTFRAENYTEIDIFHECMDLAEMLAKKNRNYGNSALDPLRVFSRADTIEQIRVRIDDKLSRLSRGHAAGEDVTLDLLGYLVLLRVAEKQEKKP